MARSKNTVQYKEQNGKCYYCKRQMLIDGKNIGRTFTIDHKIPVCCGGSNDKENKVGACYSCNEAKGNMNENDYMFILLCQHSQHVIKEVLSDAPYKIMAMHKYTKQVLLYDERFKQEHFSAKKVHKYRDTNKPYGDWIFYTKVDHDEVPNMLDFFTRTYLWIRLQILLAGPARTWTNLCRRGLDNFLSFINRPLGTA